MVRLTDIPEIEAQHLREKPCPSFDTEPFVRGPALHERRVAIVTTAGIHRRDQKTFDHCDTSYRVIPGQVSADELVMSHASVNFDRTGFAQDVNVVFPIDRLRELQSQGKVGSLANYHYALMGALWEPHEIEETALEIAALLKRDAVDAAVLVPV